MAQEEFKCAATAPFFVEAGEGESYPGQWRSTYMLPPPKNSSTRVGSKYQAVNLPMPQPRGYPTPPDIKSSKPLAASNISDTPSSMAETMEGVQMQAAQATSVPTSAAKPITGDAESTVVQMNGIRKREDCTEDETAQLEQIQKKRQRLE